MNKPTEYEFYSRAIREGLWNDNHLSCPDWISIGICPLEDMKKLLPLGQRHCEDAFKHIHDKYNISEKLDLI